MRKIRREITDFLEREGCTWYDVLEETFRGTEYGYEATFEVYIHAGGILDRENQRKGEQI